MVKFKEHDVVKLINPDKKHPEVKFGDEGTIIHIYRNGHFAVEFDNCNILNLSPYCISLVKRYKDKVS